jgi:alpha-tubulin suppressor-like RCC1 family protein
MSQGLASIAVLLSAVSLGACSSTASSESGDGGSHDATSRKDSGPPSPETGPHDAASDTEAGKLPPTPGLTKVGTGEYSTYYLVDGTIYAYAGSTGILGVGPTGPLTAIPPVPIASPAGLKFKDVVGGLHQSIALDVNGNVWTWGDSLPSGTGATSTTPVLASPTQVMTDTLGHPFTDIKAIYATNNSSFLGYDAAIKNDGTVWVWGDCTQGVSGDGTGGAIYSRPTQVPLKLPAGVTITQLGISYIVAALASDGTVWAWGGSNTEDGTGSVNDPNNPHQVQGLPTNLKQIAVGPVAYALTTDGELYGWGYANAYLGIPGYDPQGSAISLKKTLDLPAPVASIAISSLTSHAILTDGSLWSWGSAGCGGIGDGQEPFWATCGWDFMSYDMMVYKPVRIVPTVSNFKVVFANSAFDFYIYALTEDGHLYSWGRNKSGTLGNGVYAGTANGNGGAASDMSATYPNSWDVPTATEVSPMTLTKGIPTNSPCCILNPCAEFCGPLPDAGCPMCGTLPDGGSPPDSGCPLPVGHRPLPDGGLPD